MRYLAPILIVLALALGGFDASAQPFPRQNGGQQMQSLNNILGNIRSQYPGRLSDVQGPTNGRYLIKWLTPDGRVLLLDVDARSGRIVGVRGGRNFRRQNFGPAPAFLPERRRSRIERFEQSRPNRRTIDRLNHRFDDRRVDRANRRNR